MPPHTDIRWLDVDEVDAVVAAAVAGPHEQIDRALFRTAAMTRLRQGELIALRWRDVDWTAAKIRVRQSHVVGEFGKPKSKRSERSVPMADDVAAELDRLSRRRRRSATTTWCSPTRTPAGHCGRRRSLRRFRAALRAAHLDETHRFHDLRHTFGTRMAAAGVAMRTLQEWMGHRDLATTQRYADYAPSAQEASLVAAAFARTPDPRERASGAA